MNRLLVKSGRSSRLISKLGCKTNIIRQMGGHGHDDHGHHHQHMMPPFGRIPPPTGEIPEEVELVWNDTVAPETCIDFDAPNVSSTDALKAWGVAISCFSALIFAIYLSDPVGSNPVALRSTVIPYNGLRRELGYPEKTAKSAATDEEEDAEEEEEE